MDPGRYQELEIIGDTRARWQTYFRATTPAGYRFLEFRCAGIVATQQGDQAELTVTVPAIPSVVAAVDRAIREGRLVAVRFYEFDPSLGDDAPNGSEELITQFMGQVTGGSSDLYSITLQLGSSLAALDASVPPRRFTSALIGTPCRL
jgi:hypothetical protein